MKFIEKLQTMKDKAMEKLQPSTTKDDSLPSERRVKKYTAEGKPVYE